LEAPSVVSSVWVSRGDDAIVDSDSVSLPSEADEQSRAVPDSRGGAGEKKRVSWKGAGGGILRPPSFVGDPSSAAKGDLGHPFDKGPSRIEDNATNRSFDTDAAESSSSFIGNGIRGSSGGDLLACHRNGGRGSFFFRHYSSSTSEDDHDCAGAAVRDYGLLTAPLAGGGAPSQSYMADSFSWGEERNHYFEGVPRSGEGSRNSKDWPETPSRGAVARYHELAERQRQDEIFAASRPLPPRSEAPKRPAAANNAEGSDDGSEDDDDDVVSSSATTADGDCFFAPLNEVSKRGERRNRRLNPSGEEDVTIKRSGAKRRSDETVDSQDTPETYFSRDSSADDDDDDDDSDNLSAVMADGLGEGMAFCLLMPGMRLMSELVDACVKTAEENKEALRELSADLAPLASAEKNQEKRRGRGMVRKRRSTALAETRTR